MILQLKPHLKIIIIIEAQAELRLKMS